MSERLYIKVLLLAIKQFSLRNGTQKKRLPQIGIIAFLYLNQKYRLNIIMIDKTYNLSCTTPI